MIKSVSYIQDVAKDAIRIKPKKHSGDLGRLLLALQKLGAFVVFMAIGTAIVIMAIKGALPAIPLEPAFYEDEGGKPTLFWVFEFVKDSFFSLDYSSPAIRSWLAGTTCLLASGFVVLDEIFRRRAAAFKALATVFLVVFFIAIYALVASAYPLTASSSFQPRGGFAVTAGIWMVILCLPSVITHWVFGSCEAGTEAFEERAGLAWGKEDSELASIFPEVSRPYSTRVKRIFAAALASLWFTLLLSPIFFSFSGTSSYMVRAIFEVKELSGYIVQTLSYTTTPPMGIVLFFSHWILFSAVHAASLCVGSIVGDLHRNVGVLDAVVNAMHVFFVQSCAAVSASLAPLAILSIAVVAIVVYIYVQDLRAKESEGEESFYPSMFDPAIYFIISTFAAAASALLIHQSWNFFKVGLLPDALKNSIDEESYLSHTPSILDIFSAKSALGFFIYAFGLSILCLIFFGWKHNLLDHSTVTEMFNSMSKYIRVSRLFSVLVTATLFIPVVLSILSSLELIQAYQFSALQKARSSPSARQRDVRGLQTISYGEDPPSVSRQDSAYGPAEESTASPTDHEDSGFSSDGKE